MQGNLRLFLPGTYLSRYKPRSSNFCCTKPIMMLYVFLPRPGHWATLTFDSIQYSHSRTSSFMKLTAISLQSISIRSDMEMRSTKKNNFLNVNLEGQHTKRVGAMLSARSWKITRVFPPFSGDFLCSLWVKAMTACFSYADHLRQMSKWRGKKKCQLEQGKSQSNPSFSCLSLTKGETWGVNKKPQHIKINPMFSVVAVESGYERGINHSPSLSFLYCSSSPGVCTNKS